MKYMYEVSTRAVRRMAVVMKGGVVVTGGFVLFATATTVKTLP